MPQYTFLLDPASEDGSGPFLRNLENDEVAVHEARRLLGVRGRRVRVGRGAGEAVEWLGAWEMRSRHAAWRDDE